MPDFYVLLFVRLLYAYNSIIILDIGICAQITKKETRPPRKLVKQDWYKKEKRPALSLFDPFFGKRLNLWTLVLQKPRVCGSDRLRVLSF